MKKEFDIKTTDRCKKPKGWGARYTITGLGFWAMAIFYGLRFNLPIAIVAMVKSDDSLGNFRVVNYTDGLQSYFRVTEANGHDGELSCEHLMDSYDYPYEGDEVPNVDAVIARLKAKRKKERDGEFTWSQKEQGIILGSYFWGHVLTQIPAGMIAQRYGPKWPIGFGLLTQCLLTLLIPTAARWSVPALIVLQILIGAAGGIMYPAVSLLIGKWAPTEERSTLISIVYAGPQFGTAAVTIAVGYMIDGDFLGGWPSAFYVPGGISLVWFIFWVLFVHDTPSSHPKISAEELEYIDRSIGQQSSGEKGPTPWKAILTSVPLWAILVAQTGEDYSLYTLLMELPNYLKTVLHFDIKENSWMSALPQIARWISSIAITYLGDYLIRKNVLKVGNVRKLCNTIAHWGAAVAMICVTYLGCDPTATVIVLTLSVAIGGAVNGGCMANHVDIATNHAGILMGITNMASNICGIVAPYVAGLLTDEAATIEHWRIVFFIAAGVIFTTNTFYLLFATGKEQPWNRWEETKVVADNPEGVRHSIGVIVPELQDSSNKDKGATATNPDEINGYA